MLGTQAFQNAPKHSKVGDGEIQELQAERLPKRSKTFQSGPSAGFGRGRRIWRSGGFWRPTHFEFFLPKGGQFLGRNQYFFQILRSAKGFGHEKDGVAESAEKPPLRPDESA